jgi:hypothetical protein
MIHFGLSEPAAIRAKWSRGLKEWLTDHAAHQRAFGARLHRERKLFHPS